MLFAPFLALTVPAEYTPYAFMVLGAMAAGYGAFSLRNTLYLHNHGVRTTALLKRIKTSRQLKSGEHKPVAVYAYTDTRGREHEYMTSLPPAPIIGQSSIPVFYDPARPANAVTPTDAFVFPLVFMAVGILFIGYGISQLVAD